MPLTTLALAGLNTAVPWPPAAASAGLYSATPPLTAAPFCRTMTLGLPPVPARTVLMTPGNVWPGVVSSLAPLVTSLWPVLGITYTAVADLGTILVLE